MGYTRLNPILDSFDYTGTATVSNSVQLLKSAGTLAGTWLIFASVSNEQSTTVPLQCRVLCSVTGLVLAKDDIGKSEMNLLTLFVKDENVALYSYCPSSNSASWRFKGVRLA